MPILNNRTPAGEFNRRLVIEGKTIPSPSASGSRPPTWGAISSGAFSAAFSSAFDGQSGTAGTVWASIKPLSGKQIEMERAIGSTSTTKIVIRYTPRLSQANRFRFGSRIFSIDQINNPEERNIELVCTCTEVSK